MRARVSERTWAPNQGLYDCAVQAFLLLEQIEIENGIQKQHISQLSVIKFSTIFQFIYYTVNTG